jgi:hypothetical protein
MNSVGKLVAIRALRLALDDLRRRDCVAQPKATQNADHTCACGTTIVNTIVEYTDTWATMYRPHVLDTNLKNLSITLTSAIGIGITGKIIHARFVPPSVWQLFLYSVMSKFHSGRWPFLYMSQYFPLTSLSGGWPALCMI